MIRGIEENASSINCIWSIMCDIDGLFKSNWESIAIIRTLIRFKICSRKTNTYLNHNVSAIWGSKSLMRAGRGNGVVVVVVVAVVEPVPAGCMFTTHKDPTKHFNRPFIKAKKKKEKKTHRFSFFFFSHDRVTQSLEQTTKLPSYKLKIQKLHVIKNQTMVLVVQINLTLYVRKK